ncbi:hypothetical protein FZI85_27405 [Mycobacterium sp. CBMA293]|uniref:Uncharacterized protein n=1 Tax=Mycolicibacterium sp. CBMA 213 TaxID=1968788 RepID=A0A1S6GKU4_9MYCO|nr:MULTISPECIES: hypothetical protein [unclassified Mycolicibacterium]AQS22420.1 hypothetical protein pCBMA213_2_00056 [Mycolicibacterium sp. CBMA 213]MUL48476.1 hypothetical protein [Mycolicibacterium sp. CBMA 360]MUL62334.1 hypothetical protein [Mycolicibacterium sp. CBMA 335]MUM04471.1 hypothetical protein [Mycolicibacterium sp. CBMA 213]MUM14734.1 hypothetical protein [Mycolicibacterium sp. CBMA 293]
MGDTAVVEEWCGANRLRADLDSLQLPDNLRAQISFRYTYRWDDDGMVWPPQWPGCCSPNYFLGTARIYGDFRLTEWITLAPWAFGANLDPARAQALDTVAARLRAAGEGSRTLWALDLRHPDPAPALAADMLIQFGPALTDQLIASIDADLEHTQARLGLGWYRYPHHPHRVRRQGKSGHGVVAGAVGGREANTAGVYHGAKCFFTEWTSDAAPATAVTGACP